MKLLEILQRELTEFPEGMLYAVQDDDGEVKFGKHSHPTLGESGIWQRREEGKNLTIPRLELAEDWDSAIVTKDMWEKDGVKQIIVNVSDLTLEEKQRVNEALAKITGFNETPYDLVKANWMYAPSSYADDLITYSSGNESHKNKEPTHTPQQVLAMAGMETSTDQHMLLADKFIITDSSGRIIYDGTSESISTFIKSRASTGPLPSSGFSVKTDENGVAIMTTSRKVRKDFDPKQSISVDVSNCTEEEKKEVQQAFFDVGIKWSMGGTDFKHLSAKTYSNSTGDGSCYDHLMYGIPRTDSISHQQFLELVYEPEQQGHVHADLMALYAEDALTHSEPWKLWQVKDIDSVWDDHNNSPLWLAHAEYRRKPTTHTVNGIEVPDLRIKPKVGDRFFLVDPTEPEFTFIYTSSNDSFDTMWAERGLCYESTEEGKQAAIRHAKAWIGIAQ